MWRAMRCGIAAWSIRGHNPSFGLTLATGADRFRTKVFSAYLSSIQVVLSGYMRLVSTPSSWLKGDSAWVPLRLEIVDLSILRVPRDWRENRSIIHLGVLRYEGAR